MADPHLDLYSVFLILLSVGLGPELAPAVAAYIIIIPAAFVGALVALKQRPPDEGSKGALVYLTILTLWSIGITFGVSRVIQTHSGIDWRWLLFPVAFGISALGDRWLKAPEMLWGYLRRLYGAALATLPRGDK
jgi:hypothetical protein